jgi:hypothetical protein
MRGKLRANKRYLILKENTLSRKSFNSEFNELLDFFKTNDNINHLIYNCCDEDENLDIFNRNPVNVLYHILRISKRHILWREIRNLFELIYLENPKRILSESFVILYSLDLIDYNFIENKENCRFKDCFEIFLKDTEI